VEDMCYEIRRDEGCVDESANHALVNAGEKTLCERRRARRRLGFDYYYRVACVACSAVVGKLARETRAVMKGRGWDP
jgi:hypothetical protein